MASPTQKNEVNLLTTNLEETHARSESNQFAVVCLVMRGDAYVPGALVVAFSCRQAQIKADLVCMVTPDVSELAKVDLRRVFDRVEVVDYIEAQVIPMATQKQQSMYGSWINKSFTKWNCLKFVEYTKVLFMDADTLVLSNLNDLFDLETPAGTFSLPWANPFAKNGRGLINPYEALAHGDRVPKKAIEQGLRQGFVAIGTTVLLKPSQKDFDGIQTMLRLKSPFGFPHCHSGMDEQAITSYYNNNNNYGDANWTFIHQRDNFIPWHGHWLRGTPGPPRVFHYFNNKPWTLSRSEWPDLETWWQMTQALVKEHPALCERFSATDLAAHAINPSCHYCASLHQSSNHHPLDASGKLACPLLKC